MYIKNEVFKDEDTLLEMLFDFSLGESTPLIKAHLASIEKDLDENEVYQNYIKTMTDEEDRLELETEERYLRLAEILMQEFESFKTFAQKLYGLKSGKETLLYEIDLV